MIKRYHKELGFLPCYVVEAKGLINSLKWRKISFSSHSLQSLSDEAEAVKIGQILFKYDLNFDDCFEIAIINGKLEKMVFRIKNEHFDIIFVLSREKRIITIWLNSSQDNHKTLNTSAYSRV